jgi:hypothetical protein
MDDIYPPTNDSPKEAHAGVGIRIATDLHAFGTQGLHELVHVGIAALEIGQEIGLQAPLHAVR